MDEFIKKYDRLLWRAFQSGEESVRILRTSKGYPFRNARHQRRFIAACHRGYEKAQNLIVEYLQQNETNLGLHDDEKAYRELLLRKVADGIALLMLRMQHHVMRRLSIHDEVPNIALPTITEALDFANRLNNESRQTFALVADLTTFIHVADILRIDFRESSEAVSLIELKSGRVNEILLSSLEKYEPRKESLNRIQQDTTIADEHKAQAKRMLRQRIRLARIDEVIRSDSGIDPTYDLPLVLSEHEFATDSYAPLLDTLCDVATQEGQSAGVVNHCIHIGAGYDHDLLKAAKSAADSVKLAVLRHAANPPEGLQEVFREVTALAPNESFISTFDLLYDNLFGVPCEPFTLWPLKREHLLSLIAQRLRIFVCFDVISFIWLGRKIGIQIGLSSRKEAAQAAQELSGHAVPTWGSRALKITMPWGDLLVSGGMLSRFIAELYPPLSFLDGPVKTDKTPPWAT